MTYNSEFERRLKELSENVTKALSKNSSIQDFKTEISEIDSVSLQNLTSFIEEGIFLELDDELEEIYFLHKNGDKVICPEPEFGTSIASEWINDKLPALPFEIEQGGNVRKSLEVETMYEYIIISKIFNNEYYKDIRKILDSNYDFMNLKSENGFNFVDLLEKMQSLQSLTINSIVSACQIRIAKNKKLLENYLVGLLTQEEITELDQIDTLRKALLQKFQETGSGVKVIEKLEKVDRLKVINERNITLRQIISDSGKFGKI